VYKRQQGEEGPVRVSTERWATWHGIPRTISRPVTVALELSPDADIDSLDITIGDDLSITPTANGRAVILDPEVLPEGRLTLEAQISWSDGSTASASETVTVIVLKKGAITWESHIQSIYADNCSACHSAGQSLELEQPDQWIPIFDVIVEQVESGLIPLGDETLSQQQIQLLYAWEANSFP